MGEMSHRQMLLLQSGTGMGGVSSIEHSRGTAAQAGQASSER
jgi:hypothetical protein